MKLIKTTYAPPPDARIRVKTRRAPQKLWLILWMLALTILLIVVLGLFLHLSVRFEQALTNLNS